VLTLIVGRLWSRLRERRWIVVLQRGLAPVSIGLLLAGCLTFAKGALTGGVTVAIGTIVFAILLQTSVNPAFLILAGAIVGVCAFGTR
jgi:chromate transporter